MSAVDPSCQTRSIQKVYEDMYYVSEFIGKDECSSGVGGSKHKKRVGVLELVASLGDSWELLRNTKVP